MLHVPYKGIAQALADTIANEVQLTYPVLPAGLPHVQSGRLRALGVTTPKRTPLLPDVPAIGEVVPGYQMMGWYSIVVPRGTPEPIIAKITKEVARAVKEPEFGEQLKGLGLEMSGVTGRDFDAFRRDQRKRITEIVKASGVDLK
jgi:tripartite-type tricarboxylate transporter receptor subunit TctC